MAVDGKRVLAVVPARGGSKGVPLKNLHLLAGIPLIAHVGRVLRQLPEIDRAVVSTDHDGIAAEAERAGMAAPFRRPEALGGDRISDLQVLAHALTATEAADQVDYDVVLMLQPTSPLRRADHVRATLWKLVEGGWDAVWTVSPTDLRYHPLKQLSLAADGALTYFDPHGSEIVARQQLTPVYHRNGAAYAFTRNCLLGQTAILGARSSAVVIDDPMVSIDSLDDFERVERLLGA
jgi:CMP-N,N'-diacetyllegionaminic acid synthase